MREGPSCVQTLTLVLESSWGQVRTVVYVSILPTGKLDLVERSTTFLLQPGAPLQDPAKGKTGKRIGSLDVLGETETDVVASVAGGAPVAVGRTEAVRPADPGTAAQHTPALSCGASFFA